MQPHRGHNGMISKLSDDDRAKEDDDNEDDIAPQNPTIHLIVVV